MEKLLTVAVPCYNAEWCLDKCLSSFLTEPLPDQLEVIIVNDGSTDQTLKIASGYVDKYSSIFRLIDKPNGGHGSGINAAIKQATGKYFRVIDSDDWIVTENLSPFLDILENTEADVVLTHYHTIDMITGIVKEYKTRDIMLNKIYTLDEFIALKGQIYQCTVHHGLTYRTDIYRNSGTILSEGIFYEDQEYATLPFLAVETILPTDMFFYEYLVGNANQSVADKNQVKRLGDIEQVTKKLFNCYHENTDISEGKRSYIARKAKSMLYSFYIVSMIKNTDKRGGRSEAARLRKELYELEPSLVSSTDSKYKLVKVMNRLRFNNQMFEYMKRPLPYAIFRKLFKKNEV